MIWDLIALVIIDFEKYAALHIEDLTVYGNFPDYENILGYERPGNKLFKYPCRKPGCGKLQIFGSLTSHVVYSLTIGKRK